MHHGWPTIPIKVLEAHGEDFDRAAASLADDPQFRRTVAVASRPDGIWLDDKIDQREGN